MSTIESVAVWLGRNLRWPGVQRLIRIIYPIGVANGRHVVGVRKRADGLACYVDSRNWIDWNVLFGGGYESQIDTLFEELLGLDDVAVDVGANIGVHTLTLARIVGPTGNVIAFEPNPAVRKLLQCNVELNGFAHVSIDGRALGNVIAQDTLRVPSAGSAEAWFSGMASLVALETPHDLVDVDVVSLDAAIEECGVDRVSLVKIDIQGHEAPALVGMAGVVKSCRPAIVFEYEDWAWQAGRFRLEDAMALFEKWDYVVWGIEARGRRGGFKLVPINCQRVSHVECLAVHRDDPRALSIRRFTLDV